MPLKSLLTLKIGLTVIYGNYFGKTGLFFAHVVGVQKPTESRAKSTNVSHALIPSTTSLGAESTALKYRLKYGSG
jgi:hypothetical protein